MFKYRFSSFAPNRAAPSAMLAATELAARRAWEVNPNFSSDGQDLLAMYTASVSS
jgi:hypothetical protein